MYKILTLLALGLISCKQPMPKTKTLDLRLFTLKTSGEWHLIDTTTTFESIGKMPIKYFRGRIKVGDTDTLSFELSRFAYIHREYTSLVFDGDTSYFVTYNLHDSTDNNRPGGSIAKGILPYVVNSLYSEIEVDGHRAVLFKPVKTGIGTTGINFDSLWQDNGVTTRFALQGKNLVPTNEKQFMEVIKTIKFHHPNSNSHSLGLP